MRALVVDDEPLARRRLTRMLERIGDVEVVGQAGDGVEALEQIRSLEPDVVFLDIRMPGLDGLSLASREPDLPPVVFVTAYHEYAVQAFEAEAFDYLLKPIEPERLSAAVDRIRRRGSEKTTGRLEAVVRRLAQAQEAPRIAARIGSTMFFFDPREIVRFRAENKYIVFQHRKREYLLDESIHSLEGRLEVWSFVRAHRSELVNTRHIVALHSEGRSAALELTTGERVPISRRRLPAVREVLGLD